MSTPNWESFRRIATIPPPRFVPIRSKPSCPPRTSPRSALCTQMVTKYVCQARCSRSRDNESTGDGGWRDRIWPWTRRGGVAPPPCGFEDQWGGVAHPMRVWVSTGRGDHAPTTMTIAGFAWAARLAFGGVGGRGDPAPTPIWILSNNTLADSSFGSCGRQPACEGLPQDGLPQPRGRRRLAAVAASTSATTDSRRSTSATIGVVRREEVKETQAYHNSFER